VTLLTSWPTVTDGDRYTGTVWNNALNAAQKAAIEALVHSVTNPTVSPSQAIDELVLARGTKSSLDIFLAVSLNTDGTLKTQASLAALADVAASIGHGNWVQNDDLLIWPAGDVAAPAGFATCGTAAPAILRTTTAAEVKVGSMACRLTRAAGGSGGLRQSVMNSTSFSAAGLHLKTRKFGFGCWVRCAVASGAKVTFGDGDAPTVVSHTGDDTYQWLSGVHTVSGSASSLFVQVEVFGAAGDVCYFGGLTVVPGNIAPAAHVPCAKLYGTLTFKHIGVLTAADNDKDRFHFARPTLVKDVILDTKTGPATNPVIVDINNYNAGFQSMFSTKPQIAAGSGFSRAKPDGTYQYRCFAGGNAATRNLCMLSWDVDSVGAAPAGSDLWVMVRCLQYARPQESLLDPDDGI